MHPALAITVALLVPSIIVGAMVGFRAMQDARDGYEDEHGFWYGADAKPELVAVRDESRVAALARREHELS
jgi:hypothetical protein